MLENETIMRFALYAYIGLMIVAFTFAYGFLHRAKRGGARASRPRGSAAEKIL